MWWKTCGVKNCPLPNYRPSCQRIQLGHHDRVQVIRTSTIPKGRFSRLNAGSVSPCWLPSGCRVQQLTWFLFRAASIGNAAKCNKSQTVETIIRFPFHIELQYKILYERRHYISSILCQTALHTNPAQYPLSVTHAYVIP